MYIHSNINNFLSVLVLALFFSFTSCAYFNTFYNAQEYFEEAEKLRLEKDGEAIPITAMDKYGKAIKKCQKVISDYPESKFVIDASLLLAKARYYRKDYDLAIDNLRVVQNHGNPIYVEEANYWKALCKWKKGNVQTSLNDLTSLLASASSKKIKARCHLSLSKIMKELKKYRESLAHLEEAGRLVSNLDEKGAIYGRLAEMAFELNEYDLANEGYANVIAHSLSKEKVENAHLQILKIFRINKDYKTAQKKIKSMLIDDKFKRISGNLELELVQLYKSQGEYDEIESRLESIVNDYQKTAVSAEAYYQLGKIYTSERWDLDKSSEYFDMVSKEYSRSIYSPMAKNYKNFISIYQNAMMDLKVHEDFKQQEDGPKENFDLDSLKLQVSQKSPPNRSIPELFYQIADIEAFNFNRRNEAIKWLNKIINGYPESEFCSKAMFSLAFIYKSQGDSILAKTIENKIHEQFPESDYSSYLMKQSGLLNFEDSKKIFLEAESMIMHDAEIGIELYKNAIKKNPGDKSSLVAAYAIANYYDNETKIDSALKYYQWLNDNFPLTEQTIEANKRINAINSALLIINPDSSESIKQAPN